MRNVLRVEPGDELRIGILDGPLGKASVLSVDSFGVELDCAFEGDAPSRPRVDLLLALPRPKVMKRLWAQLAALGVARIILTNAARVERNYFDTHVLDPAFYTPRLIEGLQQAQDTCLPVVSIHREFKPLLEDELDSLCPTPLRLVADPKSHAGLEARLRKLRVEVPYPPTRPIGPPDAPIYEPPPDPQILLAIGPEGGWVPFELDLLRAHGFRAVGMGPRTLRVDTACIGLIAVLNEAIAHGAAGAHPIEIM